MPAYRDPKARKLYMRAYPRPEACRARGGRYLPPEHEIPADPVGALATWARETLVVPPGHPAAGQGLQAGFWTAYVCCKLVAHHAARPQESAFPVHHLLTLKDR